MPPRDEREPLKQIHMDIAASAQVVLEEAMLLLTRGLAAEYPQRNLCLAGGVALNCVANGIILREKFSSGFGFSPPPVTREARLARRCLPGITSRELRLRACQGRRRTSRASDPDFAMTESAGAFTANALLRGRGR